MKLIKSACIIFILTIFVQSCSKRIDYESFGSIFVLDTVMSVKIKKSENYKIDKIMKKSLSLINKLDKVFNVHDTDSEIYKINQNAHLKPVKASKTFIELLRLAILIAKRTNGAFDPAMLSLKKLWNFKKQGFKIPSKKRISNALQNSGYKYVEIKGNTVFFKKRGIGLDLGGIAKGYIINKVAALFIKNKIKSAFINIGGDVYLIGNNHKSKRLWRVGIQHPRIKNDLIFILRAKNQAVVTSGDYERYRVINGKRYHHIINPKTGYPASTCSSMSVISPSATIADALSTAFFVLGPERSFKFVKKFKNTYFVAGVYDKKGNIKKYFSSGIKDRVID